MGNILAFIKQLKDGGLENIDDKYQIFLDFENENLVPVSATTVRPPRQLA